MTVLTKSWKCSVCGEIVQGETPPDKCPVCGVGPDRFEEVTGVDTEFHSESKDKIVIIGNGVAGTTAALEIRNRNKTCTVTIISEEDVPGYNRPMLTKSIKDGVDKSTFFIKSLEWYKDNDIELKLSSAVEAVDTDTKKVKLVNSDTLDYDKLLIATGAKAFIPPITGSDLEGVFSIRTIKDIEDIREYATNCRSAIVVGGGVLGLEAAWELKSFIDNVTVIERSNGMMSRQLDEQGSNFLKKAADDIGINVEFGGNTDSILGENGKVSGIKLDSGDMIEADLVVLSTGIKRNTELADSMGLKIERGIVVNDKMEASKNDIYAAGDCAEVNGLTYGIWPEALEMGKIAGANAVGDSIKYEPIVPANAFNVKNISLYAIGDNGKNPDMNYDVHEFSDIDKGIYEKYYFVDDKLVGGILIGDVANTEKLLDGFKNGVKKDEFISR